MTLVVGTSNLTCDGSCMLQTLALAQQLRATGQFTVVAVTRPFGFEGTRRLAAADKMIAELESIAQLVPASSRFGPQSFAFLQGAQLYSLSGC